MGGTPSALAGPLVEGVGLVAAGLAVLLAAIGLELLLASVARF